MVSTDDKEIAEISKNMEQVFLFTDQNLTQMIILS